MKLLFLTARLPYPPRSGASLRAFYLLKHLAPRHQLHLLSYAARPLTEEEKSVLGSLGIHATVVPLPHRTQRQRLEQLLLSPLPDMAFRLMSQEYRAKLQALLQAETFDLVQVEGMEMAFACLGPGAGPTSPPGNRGSAPPIVLDEFNAEYTLQRRAFQADLVSPSLWIGALYSLLQWWKLRRYEGIICRQAQAVLTVSREDEQALLSLHPALPITVVPNGVDPEVYRPAWGKEVPANAPLHPSSSAGPTLLFTGTMDFRPNVDAVQWFCQEVLPLVRKQAPAIQLLIVGRDPSPQVRSLLGNGVVVTGEVEDDRSYFRQASVYVVPMRFGGGVRLKVLQAMASGVPVVSTPMGVQGIAAVPGRHFLPADRPQEFAARVLELLEDPTLGARLARAARRLMEDAYDWRMLVPRLEEVYQRLP